MSNNTLPITYTGRLNTGLGLMHYDLRYTDAVLGRFVQADTIVPNAGDSQSPDRFTYRLARTKCLGEAR